jgi:predicted DNA-binding transcriptional regulator AlpA
MQKYYTWKQVMTITQLSRPTIYRAVLRGELPPPIRISPGRSVFFAEAVDQWLRGRPISFGPKREKQPV